VTTLVLVAALLGGLGLCLVPSARPLARWWGWLVVLAFATTALREPGVQWRERAPRTARLDLPQSPVAARTALLAAAADVESRAPDVVVRWQSPASPPLEAHALQRRAFGAMVVAPPTLPLAPSDLQLFALGELVAGRPVALRVATPRLGAPLPGHLTVRAGAATLLQQEVLVGGAEAATATFVAPGEGELTFELVVRAGPAELRARGAASLAPPPRVLVIEPSGLAAEALRAQGVQVTISTAAPADWREFAAVLLGGPMPAGDQQRLVAAVLDGTGVLALGPSFGAGEEPIRALLPVRPDPVQPNLDEGDRGAAGPGAADAPPPEPPPPPTQPDPPPPDPTGAGRVGDQPIDVDKHTIAMVLVVDRSGSMGQVLANGRTKMSYAKSSALRTAQALGERDQVAIVTYGNKDQGRVELPLTDATDRAVIGAGIGKLAHASELTFLLSGLRRAQELLAPCTAAVKHVVVITDGEFFVSEDLALKSVARSLRSDGKATLSVIAITDAGTDPAFLKLSEEMTKAGGGQFLPISDPTAVPTFVVAEVTRALQRVGRTPRDGDGAEATASDAPPPPERRPEPPPREPQPAPPRPAEPSVRRLRVRAVAASPLLAPEPEQAWPELGGALAGTAPFEAQVLLVAGDDGWPLLAFANRGLGRVGAFAADLFGDDGAAFRSEPAFPGRLAAWLQSVLPVRSEPLPRPLLTASSCHPPLPTPHEAAALAAFAGGPPQVEPAAPEPWAERTLVDDFGALAPWLLVALLTLAGVERLAARWALRRGRPA